MKMTVNIPKSTLDRAQRMIASHPKENPDLDTLIVRV